MRNGAGTRNPFNIRRKKRKEIGRSGRRSENRLSKVLGGRLTPASGAMDGAKGDIRLSEFLLEAKSTTRDSFSVDYGHLAKIRAESLTNNKYPGLTVSFTTGNGRPRTSGEWVMVPLSVFQELISK
jgi:hypothetical protein